MERFDKADPFLDNHRVVLVGLKQKKTDLLASFRSFQSEAKFVDLQIVGRDVSHTFNCHRLVLSSTSKFLSLILKEHSLSSTFDEDVTSVIIPEMTPELLVKFANHIYGGWPDAGGDIDHEMIGWLQYLGISFSRVVVKKQQEQLFAASDPMLSGDNHDSYYLSSNLSSPLTTFSCPFKNCGHFYSSLNDVENHLFEEHKSRMKKEQFAEEEANGSSVLPHKCQFCDKAFATQTYLDYHMSTHCQDCGKKFNTVAKLSHHRSNSHNEPDECQESTFVCESEGCDKTFKHRRYLVQHAKTHERLGITCDICHKVLAGRRELRAHLRLHTGEKPYTCSDCGKAFRNRSTFNTHTNLHKNRRPNICPECNHAFIQKGDLRKHMRSKHTKEKPYSCGECGKCFARSDYLLKHSRAHRRQLDGQQSDIHEDDDVNALLSEAMLEEGVALDSLEPSELVLHGGNSEIVSN